MALARPAWGWLPGPRAGVGGMLAALVCLLLVGPAEATSATSKDFSGAR